jgi:hypothetical protein
VEPRLITDPKHLSTLDELRQREPIFHRPEFGTTVADFDAMMEPTYWETGASGQRYSREYILEVLKERLQHPSVDPWETKDFYCVELAHDLYLLTYTLAQGDRITRRATIWRRTDAGWKIVYHQGTIVQDQ